MKLFKTIRNKIGNALIPVIGTILALTILAGSVVAVALNSSRIVYRQSNLERQNDGREILYVACKYFSSQLNDDVPDEEAKANTKAVFECLQITREPSDVQGEWKYMLWYPTDDRNFTSVEEYDGSWWKAVVKMTQAKDDNNHGDNEGELGSTLFQQEAKLDELYNVGNLMTSYLSDEGLLPKRKYDINYISLIESDIDTFDEAFRHINSSGILEVDSIAIALYGYQNDGRYKTVRDDKNNYYLLCETGNLGGNYYWQDDQGDTHTTWVYRQEYDPDLLAEMINYYHPEYRVSYNNNMSQNRYNTLHYYYDDTNDRHTISAQGYFLNNEYYGPTNYKIWTYYSTIEFADALSDYIFWKNIPRLALYLDDFKDKINAHANNQWGGGANSYSYKWTDDGLTVYTWRGYYQDGGYWDWPYTISQVENFLVQCGYTDDGQTVSSQKIYNALIESVQAKEESEIALAEYEKKKGAITWQTLRDQVCNKHDVYDIKRRVSVPYTYTYWGRTYTKTLYYDAWYSTDKMAKAIIDYVAGHIQEKYGQGDKINGNTIGYTSDDTSKLLSDVHFLMNGQRVQVTYHFNLILTRNNGEVANFLSEQTGDDIYFTVDEFKELFGPELAWCLNAEQYVTEEQHQQIARKTRAELKENLVEPLRYQYLPNTTTINDLLEMKNSTFYIKMLMKFLEDNKSDYANINSVVINNVQLQDELDKFRAAITYTLEGKYQFTTYFYFKLLTNNVYNTAKINENGTYSHQANNNFYVEQDLDGEYKHFFSNVPILDKDNNTLNVADLSSTSAITTAIPFVELVDTYGNQTNQKISIDGKEFTVVTDYNSLKNVKQNILFNGDIEELPTRDFKIKVYNGATLVINGKLNLLHNQTLELEDGAMIMVNGDFLVFYEFNGKGNDSTDNNGVPAWSSNWTSTQIRWFKQHGVNIIAKNAKIMVNGNMTYRGYKARYSTSNNYYRFGVNLDLVFDQTTFGVDCKQDKNGNWIHSSDEARSLLSGIYIVNGDVKFESWAEYANPDATNNQRSYMYRNAYSNPLVNATFYVDGTFNMEGLYMSGLYDECRANFIFAKSIVQPTIALNSTLSRWGQNNNEYGNWQDTNGYLFMIVEEAMDFSKVNFACVNLFTPYSQLLQAINEHNESAQNFESFVNREEFLTMYPHKEIVNTWGLSRLLKTGFQMIYDPIDIGAIRIENEVTGDDW